MSTRRPAPPPPLAPSAPPAPTPAPRARPIGVDPTGPIGPLEPPPPPPPRPPRPPIPPVPPPIPPEPAAPPGPVSASITSWTRLEPRSRDAEMRTSLSARVFDPLWLITRQWQVGEFQAEDAGTPVIARVRATTALLSRCHLGELPPNTATVAAPYDPQAMPLEALVERRPMRATGGTDLRLLRFAIEGGLHLLRMLDLQTAAKTLSKSYRAVFIARFALQAPDAAQLDAADEASRRFVQTMVGRAPDARVLATSLRSSTGAAALVLDAALKIAAADRAEVQQTAQRWLAWYDSVFSEPPDASADAWNSSRMEHAVSVAARLSARPEDERTLSASEYPGGRLDWHSFDLNAEVNMGTAPDRRFSAIVETTVPAPVSFGGAPASRFWEFEDARIDYGLLPVGPTDLAQMLMIEYASSYGNDWFVLPLTLPVGSLTAIDSLVVTDTFGVRSLLRPIGDRALPKPFWSMWQLAYTRRPGNDVSGAPEPNLFFLPPSLGRSLEGAALEEVLFMRDEMANIAWAIEHRIESPIEQAVVRDDEATAQAAADPNPPPATAGPDDPPRYLLATTVPPNWIPLLPVQLLQPPPARPIQRLKRGAVLQPDGSQKVHGARGAVLNAAGDLLLYDEEVPREGVRVTRQRQMARWIDGSTWVWTSHAKAVGRGEGASGLGFDGLLPKDGDS